MQVLVVLPGRKIVISLWKEGRRNGKSCLSVTYKNSSSSSSSSNHYLSQLTPVNEEVLAPVGTEEQQHQSTIAQLLKPHYTAQTPVILRHAAIPQKAYQLWSNLKYLERQVGEDTPVDVEIGPSYSASEGVIKSTIRFGDYITYLQFIGDLQQQHQHDRQPSSTSNYEVVYMAQHVLFPILGEDITVPHLCSSTKYEGVGHGKLYSSLFWFGPPGSKSTLHYDPCDNLLMQFVGRKKVILYPPQQHGIGREEKRQYNDDNADNDWFYSGPKYGQQYNTSSVDAECPDFIKYPLFRLALPVGQVSILLPGDILFIPKKWWHYLRALDTSISVNVWWR